VDTRSGQNDFRPKNFTSSVHVSQKPSDIDSRLMLNVNRKSYRLPMICRGLRYRLICQIGVFHSTSQLSRDERFRDDLFSVEWDVKLKLNLSVKPVIAAVRTVSAVLYYMYIHARQVSGVQLADRLHSDDIPHDVRLADGGARGAAISLRLSQRHC